MEQTAYLPHNYEEKLKALNAVIWDAAELKFAEPPPIFVFIFLPENKFFAKSI